MNIGGSYPKNITLIATVFILLILFLAIINLYVSIQLRNELIKYDRDNIVSIATLCRDYINNYDTPELNHLLRTLSRSFGLSHLIISDALGNRIFDSWSPFDIKIPGSEVNYLNEFKRLPESGEVLQDENEFLYHSPNPSFFLYISMVPAHAVSFDRLFRWHIFYVTISLVFISFLGIFLIRNLFLPMRYVTNLARDLGIAVRKEDFVSETFNEVYKKLKLREQMLVEFSSYIAHEFRNSLGAIIGLARLVEKGKRSSADIIRECRGMEELIMRILEYSKPLKLTPTTVDVNRLIDEAISRVSIPKRIKIEKKIVEVPAIKGDFELLAAAIVNLLKNGVEAIKKKGLIEVTAGMDSEFVSIMIKDSGVGIDDRELDNIFSPFFSKKVEGMGLGLSYVKKIVEVHNGRIEVDSQRGKGSKFTLKFPRFE